MKNLFMSALLLTLTLDAHACSIKYTSASNQVLEAVKENGWGFNNYESICKKLNAVNAGFFIDGQGGVLNGQSIAWATVSLSDARFSIVNGDYGGSNMQANSYASTDKAEELLMKAINGAVNSVQIDKAINSLNKSREEIKSTYR